LEAINIFYDHQASLTRFPYPMGEAEEAVVTIETALEAGITFLDTGDFYEVDRNELLVGQVISGCRDHAFISVKFGTQASPQGAMLRFDGEPNSVKRNIRNRALAWRVLQVNWRVLLLNQEPLFATVNLAKGDLLICRK
jgi:aryl-alcohol dehydrogenase-like predicted oxidoreductase